MVYYRVNTHILTRILTVMKELEYPINISRLAEMCNAYSGSKIKIALNWLVCNHIIIAERGFYMTSREVMGYRINPKFLKLNLENDNGKE